MLEHRQGGQGKWIFTEAEDLRKQACQLPEKRVCPTNKSKCKSSGGTLQDAFKDTCIVDKARHGESVDRTIHIIGPYGPYGPQNRAVHSR